MAAFDELVRAGKVLHVAASNYSAPRLAEALRVSDREGFARYVALQPEYNLVSRAEYEGELQELCVAERHRLHAVLRPRLGVPDRQVPPRRARGRQPAGGLGRCATSTAVRASSPRSTRSPPPTRRRSRRWRWRGFAPSLGWPPRSRAPASPEQLAELLPMAELELAPEELERLGSSLGEA